MYIYIYVMYIIYHCL